MPTLRSFSLFFTICLLFIVVSQCKRSSKKSSYESILQTSKKQCTDKSIKSTEAKMVKLMAFGPRGRPFPGTVDGMRAFCRETTRLTQEIESESKECLKSEIYNIVALFLYSIRSSMARNYCGRNLRKNEARLRDSACLNRFYFSQTKCFDSFNSATAKLVNLKDDKAKIPHTCCNYQRFVACLEAQIEAQPCSAVHKEHFINFIKSTTAGLTDVMCAEYTDETDRCETIGDSPSAPNSKKYQSFILALTDLLASMGSFRV